MRAETEAEFNKSYAQITELWAYLMNRIETVNQAVNNVNHNASTLNDAEVNSRQVPTHDYTRLETLALAVQVMAGVKLPHPENPQQFLYPRPVTMFAPASVPYNARYSDNWAAAQQQERARLMQESDERQRREAEARENFPQSLREFAGEKVCWASD